MSNYLGRRVLRVKDISINLTKVLQKEISAFLPLEKISVNENEGKYFKIRFDKILLLDQYNLRGITMDMAEDGLFRKQGSVGLCVYVPLELKSSVTNKMVDILNTHEAEEKFTVDDIDVKSTIVLVTNVPIDINESNMDSLMNGFGRTLTKFQFIKLKGVSHSKYGWVVFEDIESAETCINAIHTTRLNLSCLFCCILPESVTIEAKLRDVYTVQLEGLSRVQCSKEKIRAILKVACGQIYKQVKFIRTKSFNKNDGNESYVALIDWPSTNHSIECFKQLQNFAKTDSVEFKLNAFFSLPGVSAFKDLFNSFGNSTDQEELPAMTSSSPHPNNPGTSQLPTVSISTKTESFSGVSPDTTHIRPPAELVTAQVHQPPNPARPPPLHQMTPPPNHLIYQHQIQQQQQHHIQGHPHHRLVAPVRHHIQGHPHHRLVAPVRHHNTMIQTPTNNPVFTPQQFNSLFANQRFNPPPLMQQQLCPPPGLHFSSHHHHQQHHAIRSQQYHQNRSAHSKPGVGGPQAQNKPNGADSKQQKATGIEPKKDQQNVNSEQTTEKAKQSTSTCFPLQNQQLTSVAASNETGCTPPNVNSTWSGVKSSKRWSVTKKSQSQSSQKEEGICKMAQEEDTSTSLMLTPSSLEGVEDETCHSMDVSETYENSDSSRCSEHNDWEKETNKSEKESKDGEEQIESNNEPSSRKERSLKECLEIKEEKSRLLPLMRTGGYTPRLPPSNGWRAQQILFSNLF